jgi:hypothetical protein
MRILLFLLLIFASTIKLSAQQNSPDQEAPFKLSQNYPNPVKENTSIKVQLNSAGPVTLKLYDMLGNSVSTLLDQNMVAGTYNIPVEAENIPNGIYFYVLKKDSLTQTMRMVISR